MKTLTRGQREHPDQSPTDRFHDFVKAGHFYYFFSLGRLVRNDVFRIAFETLSLSLHVDFVPFAVCEIVEFIA